jgi:hypothetical protein
MSVQKKTAALCKLLAEFERVMPAIRSQTPQVVPHASAKHRVPVCRNGRRRNVRYGGLLRKGQLCEGLHMQGR